MSIKKQVLYDKSHEDKRKREEVRTMGNTILQLNDIVKTFPAFRAYDKIQTLRFRRTSMRKGK